MDDLLPLLPQEYSFKIQSPGKGSEPKMFTVGWATVNMAQFASVDAKPFELDVRVSFELGKTQSHGVLRLKITSSMLKGLSPEEAMTEVSMMSGVASFAQERLAEQDLAGELQGVCSLWLQKMLTSVPKDTDCCVKATQYACCFDFGNSWY